MKTMNRSARSSDERATFRDGRATEMKENPTDAELAMAAILREMWGPEGLCWKSQYSMDLPNEKGAIIDFVHLKPAGRGELPTAVTLVIEVDGKSHNKRKRGHDARRTRALGKLGIPVIRFRNEDVFANPGAVRFAIESFLKAMEER